MSTSKPRLDPTAMESLLTLVRAQTPHPETMTLAEAEAAVLSVLRQVGPQLLQAALDADHPDADEVKKKGRRRCAARSRCASGDGECAR